MNKLALLLAAGALTGSAFASTSPTPKKSALDEGRKWVINVGLTLPTDDHKDAGVDTGFLGSADYYFGAPSGASANTNWFLGIGALFGQGDSDFESTTYGAHVGVAFGLGRPGEDNPWGLELKGGLYRTELSWREEIVASGKGSEDFDEDETGFGGSIALTYQSKSTNGSGLRFALGWYMMPEVRDADNRGWFFTLGFPIGGR